MAFSCEDGMSERVRARARERESVLERSFIDNQGVTVRETERDLTAGSERHCGIS